MNGPGGNYLRKVAALIADGKLTPSAVRHIQIAHDDWCGVYKSQPCNCDPDIIDCGNKCPAGEN